jgi:hypothetical protein
MALACPPITYLHAYKEEIYKIYGIPGIPGLQVGYLNPWSIDLLWKTRLTHSDALID